MKVTTDRRSPETRPTRRHGRDTSLFLTVAIAAGVGILVNQVNSLSGTLVLLTLVLVAFLILDFMVGDR